MARKVRIKTIEHTNEFGEHIVVKYRDLTVAEQRGLDTTDAEQTGHAIWETQVQEITVDGETVGKFDLTTDEFIVFTEMMLPKRSMTLEL